MSDDVKMAFAVEVKKEEAQLNLARASLLFAQYLGDPFETHLYLNRLHQFAATIRPACEEATTDAAKLDRLNTFIFEELNFSGNSADYYHPDNSFLNRVLDSRQGIPITLSVVYLEIGWLLGLPVFGVNMPGHFLVGYEGRHFATVIDVFNGGRLLNDEALLELAQLPEAELGQFKRELLRPTAKKTILLRMLNNLKHSYVKTQTWELAYKVTDLILEVQPSLISEIRDRGLLAYRLNRLQEAIFDIQHYLILAPNARDADWLQDYLTAMENRLAQAN